MVEFVNDPMQNWLLKNSSAAEDLSLQGQIANNLKFKYTRQVAFIQTIWNAIKPPNTTHCCRRVLHYLVINLYKMFFRNKSCVINSYL